MKLTRLLGILLWPALALAQTAPSADVEQTWLDAAGRGSLWVGNGETLKTLEFRAGAALTYSYSNFRSLQEQSALTLISDRLGVQVFGALGVTNWLELDATVPVFLYQRGDSRMALAGAGLGNPLLTARFGLLDRAKIVSLSAGLSFGVPVGGGSAQGNGGVEVIPSVNVGKVFGDFHIGADLAVILRRRVDFSAITLDAGDQVGSLVAIGVMVTSLNTTGPRGEVSVRAIVPLTGARFGVEAQIGGRVTWGGVEWFASLGPGLAGEPTTPQFRAYVGGAFANVAPTKPACVEDTSYVLSDCPDLDRDHDQVPNLIDACATEAGSPENNGCPDVDADGDGIVNRLDSCKEAKGPSANRGCPWPDTDKDGVIDPEDRCSTVAGVKANNGCPDADADGDGVVDRLDGCPDVAGLSANNGCPPPDTDGDAVGDATDNCPQEKGVAENAGCVAEKKQLVALKADQLELKEKLLFDAGKPTLQAKSNAVLDNVAAVLNAHPELTVVSIEAHTDAKVKADAAKALSKARAEAVRAALIKRTVAEARLFTVGFGNEKPLGATPSANDERVELRFGTR